MLRKRFRWLLLVAGLFFVPAALRAQNAPPVILDGPPSTSVAHDADHPTAIIFPATTASRPISLDFNQVAAPSNIKASPYSLIGWRFSDEVTGDLDVKHPVRTGFSTATAINAGPDQNALQPVKMSVIANAVDAGNASVATPQYLPRDADGFIVSTVRGQMGDVPPVDFTGPLSHMPYTDPGLYTGFGFMAMSTNQALSSQVVAYRGFLPFDNSIPGTTQGVWVGSKQIALNTNMVAGPSSFQPGWDLFVGWRFQGGLTVELDWKHLVQNIFSATAALNPGALQAGAQLQNTFITAQVYNFGTQWAGAPIVIPGGDVGSTFGLWDAASFMQEQFIQRFDIYQINSRIPIQDTADYHSYGLFGARVAWIVDEFRWSTTQEDQFGNDAGTALYTNSISNRMYGVHFGYGTDWYLGSTPIGAFSFLFDLEAALYFDDVKTSASYTLVNSLPQVGSSRTRRFYSLVPGVDGRAALSWYPWEGISLRIGYDVNTFFNTIASDQPIDFNLGRVTPQYEHQFLRYFYGITAGISFVW